MTEKLMKLVHKIRIGIYCAPLIFFLFVLINDLPQCKEIEVGIDYPMLSNDADCGSESSDSNSLFWPPDMIPHPSYPGAPKPSGPPKPQPADTKGE